MAITTVLFDLDGTLLPMDNDYFTQVYFKLLAGKMVQYGYQPDQLIKAVWQGNSGGNNYAYYRRSWRRSENE